MPNNRKKESICMVGDGVKREEGVWIINEWYDKEVTKTTQKTRVDQQPKHVQQITRIHPQNAVNGFQSL